MKNQKLYCVTVYGTFCKDVLVYAESEEDAIDYAQDICDNTNLISFGEKDLVDIAAEDAVDLEDECDHNCENCPVALCSPYYKGRIKQTESVEKGAPLLHLPAQIVRKDAPYQPEVNEDEASRRSHILRLLRRLVAQYYDVCDSFDELRDTVEDLLDDHFQQSMTD